jgi:hypothetical protein
MTQALSIMRPVNKTSSDAHSLSDSFDDLRQAIRAAIAGARPAMPDVRSRRAKIHIARKIWDQSVPVAGSIAENYLRQHKFVYQPDVMACVRFNSSVLHEPTKTKHPALIAPVHDLEGKFVGIHKTYLTADGAGRANLEKEARRMLGKCTGSYIQLSEADGFRLVIAETVEMGLAIQSACPSFSVWAAMSPSNMKAPVPSWIKELILFPVGGGKNKEANAKLVNEAIDEHQERGLMVALAKDVPGMNFRDIQ